MELSCVVKVGGSLLEPPDIGDLADRVRRMVAEFGGPHPAVIFGGGAMVDVVRHLDAAHRLGEEFSHWISVDLLTVVARIGERLVSGLRWAPDEAACEEAWRDDAVPILDSFGFLVEIDERRPDPLPRRWAVTSDSIAARMAAHYGAPRLVLLKSTAVPDGLTIAEAAARGFVDSHFEVAARGLREIVAVDLRADPPGRSSLRFE